MEITSKEANDYLNYEVISYDPEASVLEVRPILSSRARLISCAAVTVLAASVTAIVSLYVWTMINPPSES